MEEIRCKNCERKLLEIFSSGEVIISVKCQRCKTINEVHRAP